MASCCPKTFTGFCLADNTPIAVTIDNGVLISWTNLVTGVVTVGNPPAGTGICEVPSVVTVDIEPLTCAKDSITICPGVDPIIVSVIEPVTVDAVDFDIRNLTCATDEVTVCQGTSPWVVSGTVSVTEPVTVDGTVALDAATLAALETITVNQGTSPWVVSGTDLDIRNLACGQDAVDACVTFDYAEDSPHVSGDQGAFVLAVRNDAGTPLAADGDYIPFTTDATGALRVNASFSGEVSVSLDCATDSVTVCPGDDPLIVSVSNFPASVEVSNDIGNPLPISGTVALDAPTLAALETVTVLQGTSPWIVSGADLDIRNLTCATDSVTVCVVDPLPIDDAQSNNRFEPGVRTTTAIAISSIGNNTIITPTAGMRLRVFWIGMSTSEVGLETLAIVKFGAAGSAKYRWFLGAPGAFSHWEAIEGETNESLIVNLSIGTTVQVNVTYEEFA